MPLEIATSLTLVLTTAYYAFQHFARLQAGESVSIHPAAGGVGQIAVQVARMLGVNVIATCGSRDKRDFLQTHFGLDEDHILTSSIISVTEVVSGLTECKGVDVAVNSLSRVAKHIVQPENPLSTHGLDSIVVIEFRKWFMKTVNVDVQIFEVLASKSIMELITKAASLIKLDVETEDDNTSVSTSGPVEEAGAQSKRQSPPPRQSSFRLRGRKIYSCPLSSVGFDSNTTCPKTSHRSIFS